MKKALLIGDNGEDIWLPLKDVSIELKEIFEGSLELEVWEDYERLSIEKLREYRLLIWHCDPIEWKKKDRKQFIAHLITYVVNGGGLLGFHDSIFPEMDHEMQYLWGASFETQLPGSLLDYLPTEEKHLVMDLGCQPFSLEDEPYFYNLDIFTKDRQILYQMKYGTELIPAVWTHAYGFGKVAYLAPGGSMQVLQNMAWQRLIRRCGLWAAGLL